MDLLIKRLNSGFFLKIIERIPFIAYPVGHAGRFKRIIVKGRQYHKGCF